MSTRPTDDPDPLACQADLHEWVSFDLDGSTWTFDLSFLTSNWTCIFGNGCLGVGPEPDPTGLIGCCSYGAHFSDTADRARVSYAASLLDPAQWEYHAAAAELGGPLTVNEDDEHVTHLVDGACVFLNREGFAGGAGCALHIGALGKGERPLDWKPEVCWQLPLRLDTHEDDNGHFTYMLREWKRRDWGEGGAEFHWWCTEDDRAFIDVVPVYRTLREEIVELVGQGPYDALCDYIARRGETHFLPHPVVR